MMKLSVFGGASGLLVSTTVNVSVSAWPTDAVTVGVKVTAPVFGSIVAVPSATVSLNTRPAVVVMAYLSTLTIGEDRRAPFITPSSTNCSETA